MKKTAVIYWSGTGNTKQMAEAVLEGMKSAGAEAALLEAAQVDASTFSGVDAVAFSRGYWPAWYCHTAASRPCSGVPDVSAAVVVPKRVELRLVSWLS